MPYAQNCNDPIKDRKILNLCSKESDSQWLVKNKAKSVHVLESSEIDKKLKKGEIDTIFFRASEQSLIAFKTMGKLLQESELKNKKIRMIVIDDTKENDLVNYLHERMNDLLIFLGFNKESYSWENVDYSVYN